MNWVFNKFFKRTNSSVSDSTDQNNIPSNKSSVQSTSTMQSDLPKNVESSLALFIGYKGDVWEAEVCGTKRISELLEMALTHFLGSEDSLQTCKYKLISVMPKKVLNIDSTVEDEQLKNNDHILLVEEIKTGSTVPLKLTLQDIKGPLEEEISLATAHLTKKNPLGRVPSLDCQDHFQSEMQKVFYSLVEASAKVLAQSPDAKAVVDGIAARIDAKNKKEIDKNAVKYFKDIGFTDAQAKYALRLKRNRQVEALEWLLDNSHRVKDSDVPEASTSKVDTITDMAAGDPLSTIIRLLQDIREFHQRHFEPNVTSLECLEAMGFSEDDAMKALQVTSNNATSACLWLCGERDEEFTNQAPSLDPNGALYKALMDNPQIQLGLYNPKVMLACLSILENPSSVNMWLNDMETRSVLGHVFKTYHSMKYKLKVNQQLELMRQQSSS